MSFMFSLTYFMTSNVTVTFTVGLTRLITQNVKGSLEVALTYFLTPTETMTFVVGLT